MADEDKKVKERVDAKTAFDGYLHLMRSAADAFQVRGLYVLIVVLCGGGVGVSDAAPGCLEMGL